MISEREVPRLEINPARDNAAPRKIGVRTATTTLATLPLRTAPEARTGPDRHVD
jgi:hypothetical protein